MTFLSRCASTSAVLLVTASAAAAQTTAPAAVDAVGRSWAAAANARDADAFLAQVDFDVMLDRAARGVRLVRLNDVLRGIRDSYVPFLAKAVRELPDGGSVAFLHSRTVDGEARVVLRVLDPSGVAYWEGVVAPVAAAGGRLKVVDVGFAATGELSSVSLQRLILRMTLAGGGTVGPAGSKHAADLERLQAAAQQGDPKEALRLFDGLDERSKRERLAHLARVNAASRLPESPELLDKAVADYRQFFGDDAALGFQMLGTQADRKDFAGAEVSVDRIDASIGGDPYLDVMRSNFRRLAGDLAGARRFAESAHAREPTLYPAAETLLTVMLKQRDFAAARQVLVKIESTPAYEMRFDDGFNDAEFFAEFKRSPEYRTWLAERPAEPAASQPTTAPANP